MSISLRDIVTEEFQKEIQDSFAYATGFGVVFIDPEGRHIGKGGNFTNFCTAINSKKEWGKYCELSNRKAINLAILNNKPSIYICHAGLVNIEIPLIFEGHHVGAITAGQVIASDPDYYPSDTVSSEIDWLNNPELSEYYSEIKTLSIQQIEATTKALANMSNYIVQRYAYSKIKEDLLKKENEVLSYQKKELESQHQLMQARLAVLQKQVMPHFIFNVINSIHRLITMENFLKAKEMTSSFAKMMRYSLSNPQATVSLTKEIDFLKHYLQIQKIRFSDRIQYEISYDDSMAELQIPFFSLQPIIENSVEHGILKASNGGKISMKCMDTIDYYNIVIEDNGLGISKDNLNNILNYSFNSEKHTSNKHLGLYNCYNRFKLMYGKSFSIVLDSEETKGTKIQIKIVKKNAILSKSK